MFSASIKEGKWDGQRYFGSKWGAVPDDRKAVDNWEKTGKYTPSHVLAVKNAHCLDQRYKQSQVNEIYYQSIPDYVFDDGNNNNDDDNKNINKNNNNNNNNSDDDDDGCDADIEDYDDITPKINRNNQNKSFQKRFQKCPTSITKPYTLFPGLNIVQDILQLNQILLEIETDIKELDSTLQEEDYYVPEGRSQRPYPIKTTPDSFLSEDGGWWFRFISSGDDDDMSEEDWDSTTPSSDSEYYFDDRVKIFCDPSSDSVANEDNLVFVPTAEGKQRIPFDIKPPRILRRQRIYEKIHQTLHKHKRYDNTKKNTVNMITSERLFNISSESLNVGLQRLLSVIPNHNNIVNNSNSNNNANNNSNMFNQSQKQQRQQINNISNPINNIQYEFQPRYQYSSVVRQMNNFHKKLNNPITTTHRRVCATDPPHNAPPRDHPFPVGLSLAWSPMTKKPTDCVVPWSEEYGMYTTNISLIWLQILQHNILVLPAMKLLQQKHERLLKEIQDKQQQEKQVQNKDNNNNNKQYQEDNNNHPVYNQSIIIPSLSQHEQKQQQLTNMYVSYHYYTNYQNASWCPSTRTTATTAKYLSTIQHQQYNMNIHPNERKTPIIHYLGQKITTFFQQFTNYLINKQHNNNKINPYQQMFVTPPLQKPLTPPLPRKTLSRLNTHKNNKKPIINNNNLNTNNNNNLHQKEKDNYNNNNNNDSNNNNLLYYELAFQRYAQWNDLFPILYQILYPSVNAHIINTTYQNLTVPYTRDAQDVKDNDKNQPKDVSSIVMRPISYQDKKHSYKHYSNKIPNSQEEQDQQQQQHHHPSMNINPRPYPPPGPALPSTYTNSIRLDVHQTLTKKFEPPSISPSIPLPRTVTNSHITNTRQKNVDVAIYGWHVSSITPILGYGRNDIVYESVHDVRDEPRKYLSQFNGGWRVSAEMVTMLILGILQFVICLPIPPQQIIALLTLPPMLNGTALKAMGKLDKALLGYSVVGLQQHRCLDLNNNDNNNNNTHAKTNDVIHGNGNINNTNHNNIPSPLTQTNEKKVETCSKCTCTCTTQNINQPLSTTTTTNQQNKNEVQKSQHPFSSSSTIPINITPEQHMLNLRKTKWLEHFQDMLKTASEIFTSHRKAREAILIKDESNPNNDNDNNEQFNDELSFLPMSYPVQSMTREEYDAQSKLYHDRHKERMVSYYQRLALRFKNNPKALKQFQKEFYFDWLLSSSSTYKEKFEDLFYKIFEPRDDVINKGFDNCVGAGGNVANNDNSKNDIQSSQHHYNEYNNIYQQQQQQQLNSNNGNLCNKQCCSILNMSIIPFPNNKTKSKLNLFSQRKKNQNYNNYYQRGVYSMIDPDFDDKDTTDDDEVITYRQDIGSNNDFIYKISKSYSGIRPNISTQKNTKNNSTKNDNTKTTTTTNNKNNTINDDITDYWIYDLNLPSPYYSSNVISQNDPVQHMQKVQKKQEQIKQQNKQQNKKQKQKKPYWKRQEDPDDSDFIPENPAHSATQHVIRPYPNELWNSDEEWIEDYEEVVEFAYAELRMKEEDIKNNNNNNKNNDKKAIESKSYINKLPRWLQKVNESKEEVKAILANDINNNQTDDYLNHVTCMRAEHRYERLVYLSRLKRHILKMFNLKDTITLLSSSSSLLPSKDDPFSSLTSTSSSTSTATTIKTTTSIPATSKIPSPSPTSLLPCSLCCHHQIRNKNNNNVDNNNSNTNQQNKLQSPSQSLSTTTTKSPSTLLKEGIVEGRGDKWRLDYYNINPNMWYRADDAEYYYINPYDYYDLLYQQYINENNNNNNNKKNNVEINDIIDLNKYFYAIPKKTKTLTIIKIEKPIDIVNNINNKSDNHSDLSNENTIYSHYYNDTHTTLLTKNINKLYINGKTAIPLELRKSHPITMDTHWLSSSKGYAGGHFCSCWFQSIIQQIVQQILLPQMLYKQIIITLSEDNNNTNK